MQYTNENAARADFADRWTGSTWQPRFGEAVMPVVLVRSEAEYDGEDELVAPQQVEPGFWLAIAAAGLVPDFTSRPACRLALDRGKAEHGTACIAFSRLALGEVNAVRRAEPVWAGSLYLWGALSAAPGVTVSV